MEVGRSQIEFAFDIACPFAYLASLQVEQVAYRCGASVVWTPVLLGGLYDLSNAPQGKSGSATDSMPLAKQKIIAQDLQIQAYWVQNLDISSNELLEKIAHQFGVPLVSINSEVSKRHLRENTVRLASKGAFGVPCFIVNDQLYWGQDRLLLVEKVLSSTALPRRLLRQAVSTEPHTLVFYHDFSSPWSFFASLQVAAIAKETNAKLVYKPFLLGALFRAIKTPNVPLLTLTGSHAAYARKDLQDWSNYHNAHLKFPTIFPIRSVMALRVAIHDRRVTEAIYNAAWVEDKDISNEAVLYQVLKRAGFDANMLLQKAKEQETKQRLRDLTSEVLNLGACGAPTFLVLNSEGKQVALLWGQDRLNVVADMLCGWRPHSTGLNGMNKERHPIAKL